MGYSLSWAALKNGTLETICAACNLRPTGVQEEIPESKIVAAEISRGWHVVLYNRCEVDDHVLANLSAGGEVVSCFVEDHVMFSSASGWNRGNQAWKVFHDSEKGRYHLEIVGAPPSVLADVKKRLTEKQEEAGGEKADVDYIYDIPAELAKALTGFRHDEDIQGPIEGAYRVLEAAIGGKKSLVARLVTMFKGSSTSSALILLVFAIVLLPVLLVAALIYFPLIWTWKLVRKFRNKGKGRG